MTEILLPVGQPLGKTGRHNDNGSRSPSVRLADDYVDLTDDEYRLWLMAYALGDRAEVEATAAREAHIPDAPVQLDRLLGEGVLIRFDADGDLTSTFDDLTLLPTGIPLGDDPNLPGCVQIAGFDFKPRVAVEADVFILWSRGARHSIAESIPGLAQDFNLDRRTAAQNVAHGIRALVLSGCALLDRVP